MTPSHEESKARQRARYHATKTVESLAIHARRAREKRAAMTSEQRMAARIARNEYLRKWHKTPGGLRVRTNSHLKNRYGITAEDYKTMLAAQGGRCGICGRPPTERHRLAVDHDHRSGAIRGLLCQKCNAGLAFIENSNWLTRAVDWVECDRRTKS